MPIFLIMCRYVRCGCDTSGMCSNLCHLRDKDITKLKEERRKGVKSMNGIKKWKEEDEG